MPVLREKSRDGSCPWSGSRGRSCPSPGRGSGHLAAHRGHLSPPRPFLSSQELTGAASASPSPQAGKAAPPSPQRSPTDPKFPSATSALSPGRAEDPWGGVAAGGGLPGLPQPRAGAAGR